MSPTVTTPNQLTERVQAVADLAGVENVKISTRLSADGTTLYAAVMCAREMDAEELTSAIRREVLGFGSEGRKLTARRDFHRIHVFLPLPPAKADRGAQFIAASFPTTKKEF